MRFLWEIDETARFADVRSGRTGARYRLCVEQLSGGGWDWAVWRAGDEAAGAMTGQAVSAEIAMATSRAAAIRWDESEGRQTRLDLPEPAGQATAQALPLNAIRRRQTGAGVLPMARMGGRWF